MFRRRLPPAYQNRDPAFDTWVDGGYDDATARRLLSIISKAFRLDESDALKLRPDDSIWALYRLFYPHRSGWLEWIDSMRADELEMETLLADLQQASPSVVVDDLRTSATLGELVNLLGRGSRR